MLIHAAWFLDMIRCRAYMWPEIGYEDIFLFENANQTTAYSIPDEVIEATGNVYIQPNST